MAALTTILVPAILAGTVAIGVTVAIERLGGRLGGLIGTLPTTIVPSALGLFAQEPDVFHEALCIAPAGMLVNSLFLYAWRVLPPHLPDGSLPVRLGWMTFASLLVWAVGATSLLTLTQKWVDAGLSPMLIGVLATAVLVGAGLAACWHPQPAPTGRNPVGVFALAARGALAAGAIGTAIAIAMTGQGLLAGLASVFPAIFLTSMVGVWASQGRAVTGGAVGPMMLGSASVAVFALAAAASFPILGAAGGTAISWVLAVSTTTFPAHAFLQSR